MFCNLSLKFRLTEAQICRIIIIIIISAQGISDTEGEEKSCLIEWTKRLLEDTLIIQTITYHYTANKQIVTRRYNNTFL